MENGQPVCYKAGISAAPYQPPIRSEEFRMARMVKCIKLGKEAPGLDFQPYPGELGKRIFENVSKEAWNQWMSRQTMLINEYRLNPLDPKARKFIEGELEKFFFGEGSTLPPGYVPPSGGGKK
jgi:Fe-S cluster biosynthesis and repair protein YggX